MTQTEAPHTAMDCIFENILGFMLPFLLAAAGGNAESARAALHDLARAYTASTATELELVGRILGFSIVAMDNLRLSMTPDMPDTKILRYRANAVALSRAGDQCRKILGAVQANRKPADKPVAVPHPAIAAAPPPAKIHPLLPVMQPASSAAVTDSMRREARTLLAAFAKGGVTSPAGIFSDTGNPAAMMDAAIRQACAVPKRGAAA